MNTPRWSFRSLSLCVAAVFSALYFAVGEPAPIAPTTIALAGDSTVASDGGWGDAFARLLAPGVKCVNVGRKGRSSKSYRDEGHWDKLLAAKPAWVLIQFGHNDQPGKGPERETDPKTTFRENMGRYVDEVRAAGAKPVLVTSLTRRNFDQQGKIQRDGLEDYAAAVRVVAAEKHVPLVDLNARSIEAAERMGPAAAAAYNHASPDPAKPDTTHLSPQGAEETAKLVAEEIRAKVPDLAKLLATP